MIQGQSIILRITNTIYCVRRLVRLCQAPVDQ
jgi:hypothetical protein